MTIHELGKKFKDIFGFNPPIDMLLTMVSGPDHAVIDIVKLDYELMKHDSEYDGDKCTYKGRKGYSQRLYITEKFGEHAAEFVQDNMRSARVSFVNPKKELI